MSLLERGMKDSTFEIPSECFNLDPKVRVLSALLPKVIKIWRIILWRLKIMAAKNIAKFLKTAAFYITKQVIILAAKNNEDFMKIRRI